MRIFEGLTSRWANYIFCRWAKASSIEVTKVSTQSSEKNFIFSLRCCKYSFKLVMPFSIWMQPFLFLNWLFQIRQQLPRYSTKLGCGFSLSLLSSYISFRKMYSLMLSSSRTSFTHSILPSSSSTSQTQLLPLPITLSRLMVNLSQRSLSPLMNLACLCIVLVR